MKPDFENLTIESAEVAHKALSDMLASEGWKIYIDIIAGHCQARRDQYELVPLKSMDQVLEEQFVKGELSGLRLAESLATSITEALVEDLEALRAKRADEEKGDQA